MKVKSLHDELHRVAEGVPKESPGAADDANDVEIDWGFGDQDQN